LDKKDMSDFPKFMVWRAFSLIALLLSNGSTLSSRPVWEDFLQAKKLGHESILPDYSYAGYALGEVGIPEPTGPIFDVTDYGAVADDPISDRKAIEAAIAAAERAGGGVVFFPKGRFLVSEVAESNDPINIHGSHIVLKGSGSGPDGTEIFMKEYLIPTDPNRKWTVPKMFTFEPAEGVNPIRMRTSIIADAARGSFQITVADSNGLEEGMLLELSMQNIEANADFLDGLEPWDNWSTINKRGIKVRGERHRIKRIEGQRVTLHEPVHCNIVAAHNWSVKSSDLIAGWGVEDIHFVGDWNEPFVHHKNFIHNSGWSFLSFLYGESPYVRRSRFTDCSSASTVSASYAATLINCSIEGNQGHTSFSSNYFSYGTLIAFCLDVVDDGAFHGFGASGGAVGTVITHSKNSDRGFDWHASGPFSTLIDRCTGGLIGAGGNYKELPNHMQHLTFWNFKQTSGEVYRRYDWWEPRKGNENYSGAKVVKPIIVGYHGRRTTFLRDSCRLIESHGKPVKPRSLFEAQLTRRIGAVPDWFDNAKAAYNFFKKRGYWR
jgi:hypothetical protein